MPEIHREVELKYAVGEDVEIPPVTELVAVASWPGAGTGGLSPVSESEVREHRLGATYFDTEDLLLARAGLTLRRRTGGDDAGWHLKVPAADGARSEVRLPLGRATRTVPAPLRRMVRATARGADLVPVARIETRRRERGLLDADGRVLAELADDHVSAERLVAPTPGRGTDPASTTWREVEVELVEGDDGLLTALDAGLREHGLEPAGSSSKLARVLGPLPGQASTSRTRRRTPAGQVLVDHLAEQVAQVRRQDPLVRLDAPDSIHKMRVATRRLRSALTTFGDLVDRDVAAGLRTELRWLAAELGTARDAEVLRDRVRRAASSEDPGARDGDTDEPVDGPVAGSAADELALAYRRAHEQVLEELDGERYHRLLTALDALVEDPPTTDLAEGPAGKVLPRLVRRSHRRLRRLVEAAEEAPAGPARDETLHEARKAAKRARYAAEAVTRVFGEPARTFATAMESVQEALGEHQDAVVTRQRMHEMAEATGSPAAAFAYGRLHALEEARATDAERLFADAWATARRKSLRRWLR